MFLFFVSCALRSQCCCFNQFGTSLTLVSNACNVYCPGNSTQTCGGNILYLTNMFSSNTGKINKKN